VEQHVTPSLRWRRLGVATAVVGLLACAGGDAGTHLSTEEQIKALADDARDAGYDRQADRLADGSVTEAEYRQGMNDALACMEGQGLTVSALIRTETVFGWRFDAGYEPGSTTAPAEVDAVANTCQNEHAIYLGQAWVYETGTAFTPQALPLIVQCLDDHGYHAEGIEDDADANEVTGDEHSAVYSSCQLSVQAELNVYSTSGTPLDEGG
jgi:hypothetical protein